MALPPGCFGPSSDRGDKVHFLRAPQSTLRFTGGGACYDPWSPRRGPAAVFCGKPRFAMPSPLDVLFQTTKPLQLQKADIMTYIKAGVGLDLCQLSSMKRHRQLSSSSFRLLTEWQMEAQEHLLPQRQMANWRTKYAAQHRWSPNGSSPKSTAVDADRNRSASPLISCLFGRVPTFHLVGQPLVQPGHWAGSLIGVSTSRPCRLATYTRAKSRKGIQGSSHKHFY